MIFQDVLKLCALLGVYVDSDYDRWVIRAGLGSSVDSDYARWVIRAGLGSATLALIMRVGWDLIWPN